jgi:phosphoribosylaminoimidazole-succinocarboxamide synthase
MKSALVSCNPEEIEERVPGFLGATAWHGRSMLARKADMVPLECIVRGRLAGQAWDEYKSSGTVHGMQVPKGMAFSDAFETPMFTPSTKADEGHDINIDLATAEGIVGHELLYAASDLCLDIFRRASDQLAQAGLVLADTKFELGIVDGELVVCDEVITPDSSRIWPAEHVRSGEVPPSFDKQPFRDWLSTSSWDKTPPAPPVPEDVVRVTQARYEEAYALVTGQSLENWYGKES